MSTQFFYSKCPLRPTSSKNSILFRFNQVVGAIKANSQGRTLQSSKVTNIVQYEMNGLTLTVDTYYEETTTVVKGLGCVFKSLDDQSSYFDIDASRLNAIEKIAGLRKKQPVAQTA